MAFSVMHWALRVNFLSEMNPLVSLVKTALWNEGWEECLMAIWGQTIGVVIAQVYVFCYYSPRKYPSKHYRHQL